MCLTMSQKPAVGGVFSCSEVRVYDEPWPRCWAGVRASRLAKGVVLG